MIEVGDVGKVHLRVGEVTAEERAYLNAASTQLKACR
jgi:hypothetical protein